MISGTTITPVSSFVEGVAILHNLLQNGFIPYKSSTGLYDDLSYQIDGAIKDFVLTWAPIDLATLFVYADGNLVTAQSPNAATGEFSLAVAPQETLKAKYRYQRLDDATIQQALVDGVLHLQQFNDLLQVPIGLYPAVFEYAKAEGFKALAARYAERVNARLGPRAEDWGAQAKKYGDLATQAYKDADRYRDGYYQRAGQRFAPAFELGVAYIPGGGPVTPPR